MRLNGRLRYWEIMTMLEVEDYNVINMTTMYKSSFKEIIKPHMV